MRSLMCVNHLTLTKVRNDSVSKSQKLENYILWNTGRCWKVITTVFKSLTAMCLKLSKCGNILMVIILPLSPASLLFFVCLFDWLIFFLRRKTRWQIYLWKHAQKPTHLLPGFLWEALLAHLWSTWVVAEQSVSVNYQCEKCSQSKLACLRTT